MIEKIIYTLKIMFKYCCAAYPQTLPLYDEDLACSLCRKTISFALAVRDRKDKA
ncbi:MAG: hypothetical protein KKG06_12020 [Bacteroidetes bacterium]|nr:hypothetical protein [Bacteroidota bacterium]MBU1423881.1 hypothetical protein [Bacteroidota bacterium]